MLAVGVVNRWYSVDGWCRNRQQGNLIVHYSSFPFRGTAAPVRDAEKFIYHTINRLICASKVERAEYALQSTLKTKKINGG